MKYYVNKTDFFEIEEVITHIHTEKNGYFVVLCDAVHKYFDDRYIFIDRTPDEDGDYWIICDHNFVDLPFAIRKWFIWHEIAHIECQPVRRIQDDIERDNYRVQCILDGSVMIEELEADEYALEVLNEGELTRLMFDLDWFRFHVQLHLAPVPVAEFERRIIHMQAIIPELIQGNPAYTVA